MSSPPKEKTRKTYTRRAPKTKILDALEEIRGLVERYCGQSQEAIQQTARVAAKEAALEVASSMAAVITATFTTIMMHIINFSIIQQLYLVIL